MKKAATNPVRILPLKEVRDRIPYSAVQIWRKESAGDFPRRVRLGANRVGWLESEIDAWIAAKIGSRGWRPFEEARAYARSLKLKGSNEWRVFSASSDRPADIPSSPDQVYKDQGWASWGDWLESEIEAWISSKIGERGL